ncbi:hypothetical protein D3C81_967970 [compost metagenome]
MARPRADGRAAGATECFADRAVRCGLQERHVLQRPEHHRDRRTARLRGRHQRQQRDALPQLGRPAYRRAFDGDGEGVRRAHRAAQSAGQPAVLQQLVRRQQGLPRAELAMAEAVLVPGAASGIPDRRVQRRSDRPQVGHRSGRWISRARLHRRQGPLGAAQRDQLGNRQDARWRVEPRIGQRRHHAYVLGGMALERRRQVPQGAGLPRGARRPRCSGQPWRELHRCARQTAGLGQAADRRCRQGRHRLCQHHRMADDRRHEVPAAAACRWHPGQGATRVHEHRRSLVE